MQQQTFNIPTQQNWDALVIGSGIGGLSTAAHLATNGLRTLVLEQYNVAGGCSHVFRRKRKWEFDVGMHYVGDCGPNGQLPRVLRGLGLEGRIEFLPMDPQGFDTIVFPNLTVKVPVGWDNYLNNLIAAFPDEEKSLRRFVGIISTIGHSIDRSSTPASTLGAVKMVLNAKLAAVWALLPVAKLMDYCKLSPKARAVVSVQFGLYGCPPSRAPTVVHAGLLHNYIHGGAWYPKGGGQVFAGHLIDVIQAHGGTVRTGAHVERILIEKGRVAGVRLVGGEEFHTSVVVSNADLKKTYLDMVGIENLPKGIVRKAKNYQMSAPFLNVYLGIDMDLSTRIANSNFFSMPTDGNLEEIHDQLIDNATAITREEWLKQASEKMPAFIHCGTIKDPENRHQAPVGCSTLEAMSLMPADREFWTNLKSGESYGRDPDYISLKEHLTEIMIDRVEAIIPDIRQHIVWKEAATPLTQERYTLATDATAYGLECNVTQFGPFRPRSRTKIPGLFIAGTSTSWGPSIEGSFTSGLHAASAVLDRDLDAEIRKGTIFGNPAKLTAGGENWDPLKASTNLGQPARSRRIIA